MADKEKKVAASSADETVSAEKKAAEKVAKAAKGSGKKSDKPGFFSRAGKGTKKFFKDVKGEAKKIVWPDAKTVLKNTGIVIVVVIFVTLVIWGIDTGIGAGIAGLKKLATGEEETTVVETTVHDHDHDHEEDEGEETTVSEEKETTAADKEETTADAE
ncbi:MAG: preprotein translocase subunit SecE [Clostridia bacterium]|nr:preprotein translocase subunit SecE [Clostridia bacterium]